ncbi:MAG: TonB-dependent receptor [Alphaproteobacteria bacterium]|nr:MAG: TonB-dependent receptor [Alphaproteobacteria bacterium]
MSKFMTGVSSIAILTAMAVPATAAIDEIVVTSTKRSASAQSIPIAVSAFDEQALEELNVDVFTDYLMQMPGVTAGGSGPGQNTIYVRGLASTTPNLTTAGVAGLAPNVALYLDEQPISQPGRNLDVYAADLERIEVLAGPQGTLYGASSQAGTIRLITNKPVIGEFQAKANFGASFTKDGEMSNKVEGVINLPVSDNFAVRAVVYNDNQGGYIDNVHGTVDASQSARFRPAGTVRANGVPVSANRAGFQSTDNLAGVTFLQADNSALVEEDFNDTTYSGFRLSGLMDVNEDWSILVAHSEQDIESDGVFFEDPTLDDLQVQRYSDDSMEDSYKNTAWTVNGRMGQLEMIYTGAYTDRETDQTVDYTDYLYVGQYLPYYICDGDVTYPAGDPTGTCQAPNLSVKSQTESEFLTHEFRVNTPEEYRIKATLGVFYADSEVRERNDFDYPGSKYVDLWGQTGFADNYPFTTGYMSDSGPFPPGVIFRNDVKRTDKQLGYFGEVTFDVVPSLFSITLGARNYDIEVDFDGSANSSFCNSGPSDANAYGTDISDLYNGDGEYTFHGTCNTARHITYTEGMSEADILLADPLLSPGQVTQIFNALSAPDKAEAKGTIYKATAVWTPTDDLLFYATYSEGFRPGLLNRPGGAQGPGGYTVPFVLDTDDIKNYELGWKTDLFDKTLRFNGNIFYVEIEKLQTTIFDPSIVNLFFSDNAANAEIRGAEGEITWAPDTVPGLTVASAFSLLDTEITKVLTPTGDVIKGEPLAFAPEFQGNVRLRYEWMLENGYGAYVSGQVVHSSSSYSDIIEINKAPIDSWTTLGLRAGLTTDKWNAELYIDNVTDERAEINNNFVFDRERVTVIRPLTVGARFSVEY